MILPCGSGSKGIPPKRIFRKDFLPAVILGKGAFGILHAVSVNAEHLAVYHDSLEKSKLFNVAAVDNRL